VEVQFTQELLPLTICIQCCWIW